MTAKEKELLINFYGTPTFDAIKKLYKLEIDGLGKDALASPDHETTRFYAGQATMATKIPKLIRHLYKEHEESKG